jgi:hypothetical protein
MTEHKTMQWAVTWKRPLSFRLTSQACHLGLSGGVGDAPNNIWPFPPELGVLFCIAWDGFAVQVVRESEAESVNEF